MNDLILIGAGCFSVGAVIAGLAVWAVMSGRLAQLRALLAAAEEKLAAKDPAGQCIKGPALKILRLGVKLEKGLKSKELAGA